MTIIGVLGIALGLLAWPIAVIDRNRTAIVFFFITYILHVLAAVYFYYFSLTNISDSTHYYHDPHGFGTYGFRLATGFLYWFLHVCRSWLGGSFLDYFLVFQAFGYFGIAFLMRIFQEIYHELGMKTPVYAYLILFFPGIHFWTSSIGKDGIVFTGICMSLWAAMQFRTRMVWFGVGTALVLLIRPHIAIIMAAALALTLFFDRQSRWYVRLSLFLIATVGLAVTAITFRSAFAVDVTSAESVTDFLAAQAQVVEDAGVASAGGGNLAYNFFSLLFRPMFLDAEGFLGLIASIENLTLALVVIGPMIFFLAKVVRAARAVSFVRYALIVAIGTALALSMVYYNVGLGLRQRTMFLPALFVILVTIMAMVRSSRLSAQAEVQAAGAGFDSAIANPAGASVGGSS